MHHTADGRKSPWCGSGGSDRIRWALNWQWLWSRWSFPPSIQSAALLLLHQAVTAASPSNAPWSLVQRWSRTFLVERVYGRTWGQYTPVVTACLHKCCNHVATHSYFMAQSLNPVPPQRAILPLTSDRSVIDAERTCHTRWHHAQFVALDVPRSLMGGPQWPQMVQIP